MRTRGGVVGDRAPGDFTVAARWLLSGTCCLGLCLSLSAYAGSVGSESSLGLATEYSSNPYFLTSGREAAESTALLANLPVTYTGDQQSFEVIPRLRWAKTWGAVALLSDYLDFDGDWKYTGDRNTFAASGSWHHESTVYNQFEDAALDGRSVHRQEDTATLSWHRRLSDLSDVGLVGSFDRVDYDELAGLPLVNFDYAQASAQYDRQLSERWQGTIAVGDGHYTTLGSDYHSDNRFAQVGLTRALSERWSFSAQVAYSRLTTRSNVVEQFIVFNPSVGLELVRENLRLSSSGTTPGYNFTLERRYERATVDLAASRVIQPSGFGALLTQDDLSVKGSYDWTERWNLGAVVHMSYLNDTLHQLSLGDRRYYDLDLSATYRLTEAWLLQMQASEVRQRFAAGGRTLSPDNTIVSLTLTRQLGRMRLH